MNSDLSNTYEETLLSSSEEILFDNVKIAVSTKKKNYCGLQDDSRKKSKKKHWKPHENKKYVEFLRENMSLFEKNREDKRLMKINILMSNHVKSKNSTQCRSHHQKMLAHYKTIQNIILYLCAEDNQEKMQRCIQEPVPVEEFDEDFLEELEEDVEQHPKPEKDVFEVLDNNCWGYHDFFSIEGFSTFN